LIIYLELCLGIYFPLKSPNWPCKAAFSAHLELQTIFYILYSFTVFLDLYTELPEREKHQIGASQSFWFAHPGVSSAHLQVYFSLCSPYLSWLLPRTNQVAARGQMADGWHPYSPAATHYPESGRSEDPKRHL
jgi:hypothetical protein